MYPRCVILDTFCQKELKTKEILVFMFHGDTSNLLLQEPPLKGLQKESAKSVTPNDLIEIWCKQESDLK